MNLEEFSKLSFRSPLKIVRSFAYLCYYSLFSAFSRTASGLLVCCYMYFFNIFLFFAKKKNSSLFK